MICQSNSSEEACANEGSQISIDHTDFLAERKMNQEVDTRRYPAIFADSSRSRRRQFACHRRDAAGSLD